MILPSRGISVAATALAAVAISASPALAAKDDKKDSGPGKVKTGTASTSTSANGQFVTVTAECPKGTKAVGGGFISSTSGAPLSDINLVRESLRSGKKAWTVSAVRIDGSGAGPTLPLTAEVYCRSGVGKISESSAVQGGNAGLTPHAVDAPCSAGKAITGGGFSFAVPTFTGFTWFHNSSRPIGNVGWTIEALTTAGGISASAFAYCQKREKPLRQVTGLAALPTTSGTATTVDSAACPGSRSATAGGFDGADLVSGVGSPIVVESRRADKAWHVTSLSANTPSPNGFITAIGLCS